MNIRLPLVRAFGSVVLASLTATFVVGCSDAGASAPPAAAEQTVGSAQVIHFSGYDWFVKSGDRIGPGPNAWSPDNVFVDEGGALHLRIAKQGDTWTCAEVTLAQSLGWGTYQFEVIGRIDQLAPSVVFGLFNYPTRSIGPDGTNEIDIEFSRWGNPALDPGNYTAYPTTLGEPVFSTSFPIALTGTYTTHRFEWRTDFVRFQSLHGHRDDDQYTFAASELRPVDPPAAISQHREPVHMNLWLHDGVPPADGAPVEVVVSSFTYQP